jgi:ABC-type multidrug transport system fused ATPase/permease subunit
VAQAVLRAVLTYAYNMVTARLTQGEIVPELRAQLYAKLQRLSFSFFDVHGSNSIFNRVTGDVQNTRLFVDGVLLQGANMILTLAAYAVFMWRIQPALTLACLSCRCRCGGWRILFGAAASGLSAQPRTDGPHGAAVQRERARDADGERVSPRNPTRSGGLRRRQRPGVVAAAADFLGFVRLHAGHADVVAVEPGDFVRLRRLAVCAGQNPLGSGLVVFAGLLQQFTGQVANISTIANSVQQSLAAARRVFEVLDTPLDVQSRPGALKPGG